MSDLALEEGPDVDNEVLNLAKALFGGSSSSSSSTSTNNKNDSNGTKNDMELALNNMTEKVLSIQTDTSTFFTQPSMELELFSSNTSCGSPPRPPFLWNISTGQIHTPTCSNEKCHKDKENYKNEINTLKSEINSKSRANDNLKKTIEVLRKQTKEAFEKGANRYKISIETREKAMFFQMLAGILAAKANVEKIELEVLFREVYKRFKGTSPDNGWVSFLRLVSMAEKIEQKQSQEKECAKIRLDPGANSEKCIRKEGDDVSEPSRVSLNTSEDMSQIAKSGNTNVCQSSDTGSLEGSDLNSIEPSTSSDSITGPDAITRYIKGNHQIVRPNQEELTQVEEGHTSDEKNKGNSNTCTSNSSNMDTDIPLGGDGYGGVTFMGEMETTFDDINLDEEELCEDVQFDRAARNKRGNKSKSCCRSC